MERIRLLLLLLLPLFVGSCAKTTLNEETDFIARTWQITKVLDKFDNDITADFLTNQKEYTISFTEDGNFTESFISSGARTNISGNWVFQSGGNEIQLSADGDNRNFKVLKLSESNFNIRNINTEVEIYHIPK